MLAVGNASFTDTQYGNSSSILNTVTAAPATVAAAKELNTTYVASLGTTTVFTAGIDSLVGTSNNDNFVGDNSGTPTTVQAADQVNGGGGNDTFQYYGPNNTLPNLVAVETVQLLNTTTNNLIIDFSPLAGRGIERVIVVSVAPAVLTVNGLSNITLGIDSVDAAGSTLIGNFGTATEASFSSTGSTFGTIDLRGNNNLKTLNIVTVKQNIISTLLSTGATPGTLNISGAGALTVTNALLNSITTINASSNVGGVNLTPGNGDITFTGGSGADTLTFQANQFTTKDVLDGGVGKDTLILADTNTAALLSNAINGVKNFETLGFNGASATVNVSQITAFTDYLFQLPAPGAIDITEATKANTFTIAKTNTDSTTSIGNKLGETTANLTLQGSGPIGTGNLTLTGVTVLNLASNKSGTAAGGNQIDSFAANPDNLNIVVTGDKDLTIAAPNAVTTGTTIDASAFKANLTATGTNRIDSLTGGSGADVLAGALGADILTGGAGADKFGYAAAVDSNAGTLTNPVSYDTITGFSVADDKLQYAFFVPANLVPQTTVQAAVNTSAAANLTDALTAAANAIGVNNYGAFQLQGSTYVLANDGALAVTATDLLIGLTGNFTLTASNYVVA